jgi:Zn-dependent protease
MIPVPPLDGSRVLSYFLPQPARDLNKNPIMLWGVFVGTSRAKK